MNSKILSLLAVFLFFSGCHPPRYSPPCPPCPDAWKAPAACVDLPPFEYWWEVFQDSCLNQLEAKAVANNPNLYVANNKIIEARAEAGVKKADLCPQVTLNPHYTNQGRLFRIYGVPPDIIPGLPNTVFRIHQLDYYFPFDMSYEIDLWGRLKNLYFAKALNAQAVSLDFCRILLILTADLASYYFNMRALDAEIALFAHEIEVEKKQLDLLQNRYQDGLIALLDVESAQLELANLEAGALDLSRQRKLFENAIATLTGIPASQFCLASDPLCSLPPELPAGTPCSILTKRPDVLEAERRIASKHASLGAAYASFLPTLTITGVLGFYSPTIRDFLTWKSRWWQIGGAISQTIFDGCRKVSNLHVAWAQFHEADGQYQQTVLTAFQEVEDALNNIQYYAAEYAAYQLAKGAAQKRLSLSQERYDEGLVSYLEVLDSQRSEIVAGLNTINTLGASYQSTIQLIKAIGGSW